MKCKYEIAYSERDRMKSKPCNKPCVTSFCAEHAYCQELLDAAKALDYPGFTIEATDKKTRETSIVMIVNPGRVCWEGYALRHPKRRHDWLMQRLRRTHQEARQRPELAEVA